MFTIQESNNTILCLTNCFELENTGFLSPNVYL